MAAGEVASRRSLLRAGLAGVAGLALGALGRPRSAAASIGNPILMGDVNDAAGLNTTLNTTSTGTAFQVNQSGTGTALRGAANNGIAGFFTSGLGSGVSGVVGHYQKFGVYGANDAATFGGGAAIRANGKQNHGLVATTAHGSAVAVHGVNTAASGVAIGVLGESKGTVHTTYGVQGIIDSTDSFAAAVAGFAHGVNSSAIAGYASAASGSAIGVMGLAMSGTGYGVFSSGHAFVDGDLTVMGTIINPAPAIVFDHPLDPANRLLTQALVSSPEMLTVHSGTVSLDGAGEATVTLPDWFQAVNADVRYQLTAIGRAAPDLHVKSKVGHGRFSIAGGQAGQEVSWQLTAVRADPYAKAHRVVADRPKPDAARGRYLHPVELGEPASKGIPEIVRSAGLRAAARRTRASADRS